MPAAKTAGYSGTPLAKKLGIVAGTHVRGIDLPPDYAELLAPLPDGVVFDRRTSSSTDVVHLFVTRKADLATQLTTLRTGIRADAAVWVSWPKKTAKAPTDITEDTIRTTALPMGFVDIKVCAVSDTWSALKLVIRKELR